MRSDTVTKGKQQAPHRSLFNALGLTEEEMNWKKFTFLKKEQRRRLLMEKRRFR